MIDPGDGPDGTPGSPRCGRVQEPPDVRLTNAVDHDPLHDLRGVGAARPHVGGGVRQGFRLDPGLLGWRELLPELSDLRLGFLLTSPRRRLLTPPLLILTPPVLVGGFTPGGA